MFTLKTVGFVAGPLLAFVAWMLPAPDGMSDVAHAVMVVGMWISNTATALIMMLIAFTVGKIGGNYKGFNPLLTAILLSVAYGSCIEMK